MILLQIKHNTLYHNYHESILTQDRRLTIESISLTVSSASRGHWTIWTWSNNAIVGVQSAGQTDADHGQSVLSLVVGYSQFVQVYTIIVTPNCALCPPVLSFIDTFTLDYSLTFLSRLLINRNNPKLIFNQQNNYANEF